MAQSSQTFVVVDASLVFKWFVEEEDTHRAVALLEGWLSQGVSLAAPHFMVAEVVNAFLQRVRQGQMSTDDAEAKVEDMLSPRLGIELHAPPGLYDRALAVAGLLQQSAVYDSIYLALAEALGGELWTADERFFRAASAEFGNVRWLREADVLN